jgi:hypothetical protein
MDHVAGLDVSTSRSRPSLCTAGDRAGERCHGRVNGALTSVLLWPNHHAASRRRGTPTRSPGGYIVCDANGQAMFHVCPLLGGVTRRWWRFLIAGRAGK